MALLEPEKRKNFNKIINMSKFLKSLAAFVLVSLSPLMAQQLPDPGFENWNGTQFDSKEQPKYWNYSNVEQLGVKRNFAHKTTGRSGYALKIQDQFVGVGSIGATSPGYVALGQPWAYVSSLTSIEDATAGTYGGISWTHRPDSMVVWIKRYYDSSADNAAGDHCKDENFNLIYYAWSGTSYGKSYKAKNLSCTQLDNISDAQKYCVDEESDIRQALDGNECETKTYAKQIAEGWFYQKKSYANWTRIVVPIYYFNDDVPQKCNVILSAGNYPNFRANSGQNAGTSMDVDDISLIYSSKAQKLYIGGREWKAFDPNNTGEQVYSLGLGATEIPEIYAVRGAGSLTNNRGGKASFPGRRLGANECTITYGQVDGAPTTITIRAEDGSSTTTYRIKFVSQTSNNARLADIKVNGETISGFNAYLTSYDVALPYGTTDVPVVSATAQDGTATIRITQPSSVNGTSTILVTAGDGTTTLTYTLHFSVAALTDVTLKNIFVDGSALTGFQPNKSNYTVSLPLGTTAAPAVTWESAYPAGTQTIQLLANTLEGGAQIQVSLPGTTLSKTYKLTYKIEASSYSYLAGIALDGTLLEGFSPEQTVYSVTLPLGTTVLPAITWTKGDPYQTVQLTEGGVEGTSTIKVTAASGATTTYRLQFRTEKSTNNALAGIQIDGTPLENFDPDSLVYAIVLPAGSTAIPVITYTTGDVYQTVNVSLNQSLMTARLTVTAGDGSTRQYTLVFEVQKSENALLQMIYLNGTVLEGFEASQLDYTVTWPNATMPTITVLPNEGQSVTISAPATYGTARIVVTPEEGTPNTYTVRFVSPNEVVIPPFPTDSFPASNNATLAGIYIDGQLLADFRADRYDYTYALPRRTTQIPAIFPVAGARSQTIAVAHGAVDRTTTIYVMAADGTTSQTYHIAFPAAKSNNTALLSVEIEGANFTFDPAQHHYTDIELPYGLATSPSISVERGEPEQALVITEAPVTRTSSVVVTAEDGTQEKYTFRFRVTPPAKPNELLAIVVDGVGELDMTHAPNFTIDLPYGTTTLDVVSVTKNYPEQQVYIVNGGVTTPTTITVKSLNPEEPDYVYTLTPNLYPYDPAQLLDIQIDSVSLPQFDPNVYDYVVSVDSLPTVTATAQSGAIVDDGDSNSKYAQFVVEDADGLIQHTYRVYFFYPNDYTFDMGFNNFDYVTNDAISSEKAYCPHGWNAPISATTTNVASPNSYYPSENTNRSTTRKEGAYSAVLTTSYLTTSAESMPGVISLSKQSVVVGRWYLGIGGISSSSTLAFGEPITFRNTPDTILMDYNTQSASNVSGWRFVYTMNGETTLFTGNYNSNKTWRLMTLPVSYAQDLEPTSLDIKINSAHSEVPNTFYTNYGASRATSEMLVDNLRFRYNNRLNGLTVNGAEASMTGTNMTASLDADSYGMPKILFNHAVSDQMSVINWSEETAGIRTATIRNYGEDLSYTDYNLIVTRPQSTNTACTYVVNGLDLTVTKASPYQTIAIAENDTSFVITVTAESGAQAVYYAPFDKTGAFGMHVTKVTPESLVPGVSTAHLLNLTSDPVLNYEREYALDSVFMILNDRTCELHVYGSSADTTYIIDLHPSSNALLASMEANHQSVPAFYSETYDYTVSLPSIESFEATAEDPEADVRWTMVQVNDEYYAFYVLVTAADGQTQKRYSLLANVRPLSSDAYLTAITANDALIAGFASNKYTYTIQLLAHSSIPTLSSIACAGASVETQTTMNGSSAVVTFTVTSEDETVVHVYTVNVKVQPSEICTLDDIIIGNNSLEGFAPTVLSYTVELPYGTTTLPDIEYILTDKKATAVVTVVNDRKVTIVVTAEDGSHRKVYTILFTIAKSTNAYLQWIALDGTVLSSFFAEEFHYDIDLPFGAPIPAITAGAADSTATVKINGTTITVTAEDGVTKLTYTLSFHYLPSTNANLLSIELDGVQQKGFQPDHYEYTDTVLFGAPMPVVTWTVADEQQVVDTAWVGDTELTINVTAGDGTTTSEYILTFFHRLSSNCRLADLKVRGTTVEGFHPDSVEYTIEYPVSTPESALFVLEDVSATPEDPDATLAITMEGTTATILVTAPDGTRGVYVVQQVILLSSEARLRMVWLDEKELRDFEPDTLNYTIILTQGANIPLIDAETIDSLATWDQGMPEELENGYRVQLFTTAQDGSSLTYTLTFDFANWNASTTIDTDDYLFFPIGGGQFKAVTIGVGVQLGIYDLSGRMMLFGDVPTADPADVEVAVEADGNQRIVNVLPSADGLIYTAPEGHALFYVFFDSKTKKIAKGGKFEWNK